MKLEKDRQKAYAHGHCYCNPLGQSQENSTNDVIGIWDGSKIRIELDTDSLWLAGAKALLRFLVMQR